MKKISLLSLGKIADAAARARIAEHCDITEIEEISEEALLHHLPGYEAVIVPVFQAPARLLNRSILYTAVTRAKRLLEEAGYQAASPEEARQIYGLRPRT